MKTLTRALLILTVFAVLAGIVTVSVNLVASVAVSMGLIDSAEERASEEAAREAAAQSASPAQEEERNSPEDFNLFVYAARWILSLGKDVFIIAIPVFAIVIPKSLFAKLRKRA